MPRGLSRWLSVSLLIGSLAGILGATLVPASGPDTGTFNWCLLCGSFGLADAIANVVLFVPLGIGLRCSGTSGRRTVALALLLSTAIEIAQLWIPGRESTLGDIVWNTTGAALGMGLAAWYPARRRFRVGGFVAAAAALLVIAGTGVLLRPSFPPTEYYGQWTADLGMYEWYRGHVLAADLGGLPLPSWRLEDSKTVRERLVAGESLRIRALAGPRTGRLAPLFSIFDGQQREILLVGADRDDLVLHVRSRAVEWRLHQLDLRWRGALAGVVPGDTLSVELRGARSGYCFRLNGREHCGLAYTAGEGWGLVQFPHLTPAFQTFLDCVLMALLGWWVGLLSPRRASGYLAAALVVAGSVIVPSLVGLAGTPLLQVAALVTGIALGGLVPEPGKLADAAIDAVVA